MSYDRVRLKMGGEGMKSLTRILGSRETSVANYRDPSFDVYVEYDHRIDRRPAARVVLVRASVPLLPANVKELVDRFGVPDAGAADLKDGLHDGVAVWVDELCGVVLTAYHLPASWWAAEGGTTLRLETLDLALKGESPGSSRVRAILERKKGFPAAIAMDMNAARGVTLLTIENELEQASEMPSPMMEPVADSVETNGSLPMTLPTMENETEEPPSIATEPAVVSVVSPQTIATWRARVSADLAPTTAPKSNAKAPAKTIATWHAEAPAGAAGSLDSSGTALHSPDRPAERITFVPPVYPPTARWLGKTGHVTLAIVVEANGTVARSPRVVAVRPPGRGFAESAIDAVQKWRYRPAIHGGRPVASKLTVGVEFE